MSQTTLIQRLHRILTAILLVTVIGFAILNTGGDSRADDNLVSSQQISDSAWLYVTEYSGGGATVANIYRYYLSGKREGNIPASLAKQVYFMEAAGSAARVSAQDNTFHIQYSGRVFSFSNSVVYEANGKTFFPHINFQASN